MKCFCVSIILAIIATTNCQSIESMVKDCMEQEGASMQDAQAMQKMQTPETRTQKCFYACMFEHLGTSDGQRFDTERFLQVGEEHAKGDQNMLNAVQTMADRCDGTENADRCELAADITACLKGH